MTKVIFFKTKGKMQQEEFSADDGMFSKVEGCIGIKNIKCFWNSFLRG